VSFIPLELSFRTQESGGEINATPDLTPFEQQCWSRELILLIHGFNDPVPDARTAYDAFIGIQQTLASVGTGGDFAPGNQVIEVFWKGDDWGILSALYYVDAVPNAVTSGGALGRVLLQLAAGRGEALEVSIVAHSLGTRVALEALKALDGNPAVQLNHVVFFAAATATFMLESPQEPHGLRKAWDRVIGASVSLYSKSDDVLALAFPPGQTFSAGHEGFFPTALGHQDWIAAGPPPLLTQVDNANAGHSDYWGWRHKHPECELLANVRAKDTLGLSGSGPRVAQTREPPVRDDAEARVTPLSELQSRETAFRTG
jgi:hypothetical protein